MRVRSVILFVLALAAFLVIFTCLFGPHLFAVIAWGRMVNTRPDRHRTRVAKWSLFWADIAFRVCAKLLRIRVDFRVGEMAREPVIVISNHQSALDILVLASLLRRCGRTDVRWVVKRSLRRAPITGFVGNEMACAFVSRTGDPRDAKEVAACARAARDANASVLLFPEGTRFMGSHGENGFRNVLRPKSKGFRILRNELPAYPVLSVTLRWTPPVGNGRGKTMFDGSDFVGKSLAASAEIIRPDEIRADPDWLTSEWHRKDDLLATA